MVKVGEILIRRAGGSDPDARAANLAASAFMVGTIFLFCQEKWGDSSEKSSPMTSTFMTGLSFSFLATIGNTAASMLRKQLSSLQVSSAEQVGLATLIQGFGALVYCQVNGLSLAGIVRDRSFVIPAVASSALNALTKTVETRAFATTDVSLCAPFLAFDPVMQFLLPAVFAPLLCAGFGVLCDEAKTVFPAYHPVAVGCVAAGAFLLKLSASSDNKKKDSEAKSKEKPKKAGDNHLIWGLPLGSWCIIANCAIYAVTSRLDKAAVVAAQSKALYFTYSRVVMGATATASARPTLRTLRKFINPHALVLLLSVCAAEAFYLLALYQAFATISPVYVTAIKRGGGLLFSAFASAIFFNESISNRLFPILSIVTGVVFLCL